MAKVLKSELFATIPTVDEKKIDAELTAALKKFDHKIIVLDDDPTGVQTVNGINVYTQWTAESIADGFAEPNSMFFILTNSRAFSTDKTRAEHQKMAELIASTAKKFGKKFMVISRSDSTLRGHYPLETEVLRETLEREGHAVDGEVMMPFFKEGGRFTIGNVHYVQEGDYLVPAGETEFAKDKTFGYTQSDMTKYIEEKTHGKFKAADVTCISLDELRAVDVDGIAAKLEKVNGFNKVIVNAVDYVDVKVFALALLKAMSNGKSFMFRTAAAFTKVIGGVPDKALLKKDELIAHDNKNGGLIIVGSHVKKTTQQFEALKTLEGLHFIEFDIQTVFKDETLAAEMSRVVGEAEKLISNGQTVVIYTTRKLLTLPSEEASLQLSVKISSALTSIVDRLSIKPSFLIAKGGITSSDVGTIGLHVKRALVLGQVAPGIPVWKIGDESKFPGMSYIIFPGNVGGVETLHDIVEMLGN